MTTGRHPAPPPRAPERAGSLWPLVHAERAALRWMAGVIHCDELTGDGAAILRNRSAPA